MGEALIQFGESLRLAKSLYEIDKKHYRNPPRQNEVAFVQGLRGGAAVLCIAAFERFCKTVFAEKLSVLSLNPPPKQFITLPEKMRINSIYYSLERAMKGSRHGESKDKIDRLGDIIDTSRTIGHIIDPTCFSETGSNPNPENVKRMFKDIGISEVFVNVKSSFERIWGGPVSDTFISDKLLEIVNRRHVVAHTADALNISRSDLTESFKFLSCLAQCLNDKLDNFISRL